MNYTATSQPPRSHMTLLTSVSLLQWRHLGVMAYKSPANQQLVRANIKNQCPCYRPYMRGESTEALSPHLSAFIYLYLSIHLSNCLSVYIHVPNLLVFLLWFLAIYPKTHLRSSLNPNYVYFWFSVVIYCWFFLLVSANIWHKIYSPENTLSTLFIHDSHILSV